jgi:hypothetical protein
MTEEPAKKNNENPPNPPKKRIAMDKDQKRAFNQKITSFLGVKYSKRPEVSVEKCVEPTLFHFAHDIVSTTDEADGRHIIYLGPKSAASQRAYEALREAGIVAIVNCTNRVPCFHRSTIKYCQIPINDEETADILTYLEGATTFLHAMLQQGSVLVHCEQGMSRSASVVMAYLMRFHGMTRDEAYVTCKSKRKMVNPNEGFWRQLEQYEANLLVLKQQRRDAVESKVKNTATTEHFDSTWALHSNALYSTCREIPETILPKEASWQRLANLQTREEVAHVLFVCLDFLWGRGILDVDLDWLICVCRYIPPTQEPFQQVKAMLRDPESEFSQTWSGEIYSKDVNKILEALSK